MGSPALPGPVSIVFAKASLALLGKTAATITSSKGTSPSKQPRARPDKSQASRRSCSATRWKRHDATRINATLETAGAIASQTAMGGKVAPIVTAWAMLSIPIGKVKAICEKVQATTMPSKMTPRDQCFGPAQCVASRRPVTLPYARTCLPRPYVERSSSPAAASK